VVSQEKHSFVPLLFPFSTEDKQAADPLPNLTPAARKQRSHQKYLPQSEGSRWHLGGTIRLVNGTYRFSVLDLVGEKKNYWKPDFLKSKIRRDAIEKENNFQLYFKKWNCVSGFHCCSSSGKEVARK